MAVRRFDKWVPWMVPRKNNLTDVSPQLRVNLFKEFMTNHQVYYSSHVVTSPFPKIDIPQIEISDLMSESVDRYPEAIALKCGLTGRSYKYAEVQKLSRRFMNTLKKAGFSHNDVIAIVLPNCPEFAIATLGALEADMTVTLINPAYTAGEISHHLKDSGSICVVSGVMQLKVVQEAVAKLPPNTIKKIIAVDIPSPKTLPEGVVKFSEAIGNSVDHKGSSSRKSKPNELAVMPYSSGTMGLAKGVRLSHTNIISSVLQLKVINPVTGPDKNQDIILGLLPFFHIYGFVGILVTGLMQGGQTVTLPLFKPELFIQTLEKEKISIMLLVPTLISFLGIHPMINREKHLSKMRFVVSGADLIQVADMERLKAKLPTECVLVQGYGMTELSTLGTLPTIPSKNLKTCGVPVSNTEAKVVSIDGKALGPNQTGELWFRGPQVMQGYHNEPKATADMLTKEGWLKTGDIGYYDESNHFYIEGRLKELIKVKGFQVAPAELEKVLRSLPGVREVGIIGVPESRSGETPVAYVAKDKESKLTEDQIKEFISKNLAEHKQVSRVFFVDEIPKSASGKILRKELRQWFEADQK